MTKYETNNIFARILRGEIPCHKLHEDAETLAFLDVMPQADGHSLIIPKAPSRNLLSADPSALAALMVTVQLISRAVMSAFGTGGVLIQQFNEAAAGQTVFHTHFHVIPRHEGVPLRPHTGQMADTQILKAHAEKIRAALAAQ
jgi:histidine triad (HIT) family protein